jgi:hypothetical protein
MIDHSRDLYIGDKHMIRGDGHCIYGDGNPLFTSTFTSDDNQQLTRTLGDPNLEYQTSIVNIHEGVLCII